MAERGADRAGRRLCAAARLLALIVLLPLLLAVPAAVPAQDLAGQEFDARLLSPREKRVVQAALAFAGDYVGMLDGAWGKGSQRALERYSRRTAATDKPLFRNLLPLLTAFEAERISSGWMVFYPSRTGVSLAIPQSLLKMDERDGQIALRAPGEDLVILVNFGSLDQTLALHGALAARAEPGRESYQSFKPARLITSIPLKGGSSAYMRSDPSGGIWVSFTILAASWQGGRLAVIAGSIQRGRGEELGLPPGGVLAGLMRPAAAAAPPASARPASPVAPPPAAGSDALDRARGSGTGFYLNATDLLTASHVVHDCAGLSLQDGTPLTVVADDPDLDLAVITGSGRATGWLRLRLGPAPVLGEPVTALGYPYLGNLGQGLTVTTGNVSALHGIDGRDTEIMISAPVQPGNSGGPLLDRTGAVLGVVVARVDDLAVLKETGTLPQNMNFAVPNSHVAGFLDHAGVMYQTAPAEAPALTAGLPATITAAAVPVLCY